MKSLGNSAISINLREKDEVILDLLKKNNVKTIIHLANPIPNVNQEYEENEGINLAKKIVKIADSVGKLYFILLSSIRVYPNGLEIFDNNTPLNPIDGYGNEKLAVEEIIRKSKHRVLGLRVSSVMGIGLDGLPRGLIGTFINQSFNDRKMKVMGDGAAKKDLIHISDLVKLLVMLIEQKIPERNVFLPVGGGKSWTVLEIATFISKETGSDICFIEPALFELSNTIDNSEICKLSSWSPTWDIENMILESIEGFGGK